jgi:acetyltransferase
MSKEWTASDGRIVTIRTIRPTDLDLEVAFVNALSRRTGYQRLMSGRTPTPVELKRWTEIDPQRERALIAVTIVDGDVEQQVGVARFVHDAQSGDAEFAIVLRDAWQGLGLGAELLRCLIAAAREFGVNRLVGTTLASNRGMIALCRKLAFAIAEDPQDATIANLTLNLSDDSSRLR